MEEEIKLNLSHLEKSDKWVGGVVLTGKRYQSRKRRSSAQEGAVWTIK